MSIPAILIQIFGFEVCLKVKSWEQVHSFYHAGKGLSLVYGVVIIQ